MKCTRSEDPFSDWAALGNKPVYSCDKKKIGFLRKILPEYMVVQKGLINLASYLIPKSLAVNVDKKGIRLGITAQEVKRQYSYSKMRHLAIEGKVPKSAVQQRVVYDRLQTLRYGTTRNRLAASIAFLSGILFLLSGYRANIAIYNLIREQLEINTARDFWTYALLPVGALALLAQLGGLTVLMGAGLFAANRVTIGKVLVMVGTGQGIITILIRILLDLFSGMLGLENNYVTWLTSTAAGVGVIFAIVASIITKGKGGNIYVKTIKFLLRKRKKD
jgi:branched-subunit amino acid transport protein